MSKPDKQADYTVGFGKPPAQHRFKKGQSGNPKGRPKKGAKRPEPLRFRDGHLDSLLEQEAFRSLHLQENGKTVEMTAAQAVLRSLMVEGVKGGRLSKKLVYELLQQEEREARQRQVDRYIYFAKKKAEGEATIARCKRQGLPPPRLFPHPDDILLDEAKCEVHLFGPLSEDEAIPYERGALIRDWLHARAVFLEKYGAATDAGSEETSRLFRDWAADNALPPSIRTTFAALDGPGQSAFFSQMLAHIVNGALPPSFQRNEHSTVDLVMQLQSLGKAQLRQRMRTLTAQLTSTPKSIAEQLSARERFAKAVSILGEGLEEAAARLAKSPGQKARRT